MSKASRKENKLHLTLKVKQHTPIIHFQSCQKGATLRATELKPKLDKFVISELKTIDEELFTEYKDVINENNFPLKGNAVSAKYQIRICADDNNGRKIFKFAKDISDDEKKKGIHSLFPTPYFGDSLAVQHDKIELDLFGFNSRLNELIKKAMQYVLVYNNFGTRQGKGFGSFLPEDMKEKDFEEILSKKYQKFWVAKVGQTPFAKINRTYQLLKSGINHNTYDKSKLFEYMCSKNIRWEKRKIKEKLKANHSNLFTILKHNTSKTSAHRIDDCDPKADANFEYRYIRAMLGLAEHNEYAVKDNDISKIQIRIEDPKDTIKRYKSPVMFKVFNSNIYLLPNPVNSIMYDREFTFNIRLKYKDKNKENRDRGELFKIKTPDKFDLTDFLSEKLSGEWKLIERGQA